MAIKAAFFDIDNTLFDYKTMRFVPSTIEAIKEFQANGGKAFIASARCYDLIRSFGTMDLGIKWDGWTSFCGGVVSADHKIIYKATLPPKDVRQLVSFAKEHKAGLELLGIKTRFLIDKPNEYVYGYHKIYIDPLAPVRKYRGEEITGAILLCPESYDKLVKEKLTNVAFNRFQEYGADIGPNIERTKGFGCKVLLDYFGIKKEEAIAFGDSMPDVSMADACGTLVIVGNGEEEAKKYATIVSDPVHEDGVAKLMRKLKMIGGKQK